jgi:dTMP kinase
MADQGLFITFEGSEGCGKSTQLALLADRLRPSGRQVVALREPGGTPLGEKIRDLLQFDPSGSAMTPEAELLLFAASRAQLVRRVIGPALARGAVVLCDRFLDSTTVYQGVARSIPSAQVASLNAFATGGILPDATLVLDLEVSEGRRRAAGRRGPADRMEQEPPEFYEAVRRGYRELAASTPRLALVGAEGDPETVAAAVWEALRTKLRGRDHGLFR